MFSSNHIVIQQSAPSIMYPYCRKKTKSMEIYSIEKLSVETINKDKNHLRSFYQISHVKRRRKIVKRQCSFCGK